MARVNGQPALAIAISMREGGDILKLGEQLDSIMPDIRAQYPWGIELDKIWFQAELVKQNVDNFINNLLQAVAIVCLVIVIFWGWRPGS